MTRVEELRELRHRWTEVPDKTRSSIVEALAAGRDVESMAFGHFNGRVDLRGFPLSAPISVPESKHAPFECGSRTTSRVDRYAPQWRRLDLAGAVLADLRWFNLTIHDCVLDDADLRGLRCWGISVRDTTARRARLQDSQLGSRSAEYARSNWHEVDLRQADLRGVTTDARFEGVDFRHAKLRGATFNWSDLIRCRFAGIIHNVTIGRRPIAERPTDWHLDRVDFSQATPRQLTLIGVDLGNPSVHISLPNDAAHWLISDWPGYLGAVADSLRYLPPGDLRLAAQIWHQYALSDTSPEQTTGFIAAWDLEHLGGSDLRHLLRGLEQHR